MAFTDDELRTLATQNPQEDPSAKLSAVADYALIRDPVKHAKDMQQANKIGVPVAALADVAELATRRETQQAFVTLPEKSPRTASWVAQHPDNGALIRDSLDLSAKLEEIAKAKKAQEDRPFLDRAGDAATGAWVAAGSILPRTGGGLLGVQEAFAELFIDPTARAIQRAIGVSDYSVGEQFKPGRRAYEKQAGELGSVATETMVAGGVPEGISSGVTSGFQMVGQIVPALIAPSAALPLMTGTVAGEEYGKARDKGLDPLRAAVYGTSQGAVEYATEKFAMGRFLEAVKKGNPIAKAAVGMLAKEIPGEQMATAIQDLNQMAALQPEKTLGDYMAERPDAALQTLVATLVGGGAMVTVSAAVDQVNRAVYSAANKAAQEQFKSQESAVQARDAEQTFSRLKDAITAANEHPLRARHEGKFHEFLTEVLQESDLSEVYFDAKTLNDTLLQSGADLAMLKSKMPSVVAQIQEGYANEGTVRVSTADLLTHVQEPGLQNALLSIVRRAPDGMTYDESQAFFQTQAKDLEAKAQEIDKQTTPTLTREEFDASVADQATPEGLTQLAQSRLAELYQTATTPEQVQEINTLSEAVDQPEALAQLFGKQLVAEKPTYVQHLKTRNDAASVRAVEVENLRSEIIKGMRAMNTYTESVVHAMATPLTELYRVNSAKMNMLPSELMQVIPLKFLAEQMSGINQQEGNKATRDTFNKDNIKDVLSKTDWAILTAENPNKEILSAEENAQRNAALEEELKAAGYDYIKVDGVYDRPDEKSFIVLGIPEGEATALGNKYQQDSILTREGFIYQDGTYTEAQGVTVHSEAPEAYYTTLPDGTRFTIGLEMDADYNFVKKSREAKDPAGVLMQQATAPSGVLFQTGGSAKEGAVSVVGHHFSPVRRPLLEGRKYGSGIKGAEAPRLEQSEDARIKERLHFYIDEGNGVFPEAGVGREEHVVQLHNMYDAARNPLRIKAADSNGFEAAVIDAGFDGYYVQAGFGRQGVAVLLGKASHGVVPEGAYKQVEASANNKAEESLDELKAAYAQSATKDGVVTIDVDMARELFPEYAASNNARTRFASAVHEASSKVAKAVYADVLKQAPAEGKVPLVIFTAGGGGSGKSSARAAQGELYNQAQAIYDGTLSDYDSAKVRIEAALAAGKKVAVQYVSRDPVAAWSQGVLPRAVADGRIVGLYAHAAAHRGAARTIKLLAAHYANNPNVDIQVIENNGGKEDVKLGTLDSLASVNYNDLEARLFEALDKEFQNGNITRQIYEAAKVVPTGLQGLLQEPDERGYFQSQEITRPAFYSALTRAVEGLKQVKGDPDQWIGIIKNLKGVKKDEVNYTGIIDRLEVLKAKGNTVVTREEIVAFLRDRALVINPLVKAGVNEEDLEPSFSQWETEEPDFNYLQETAKSLFEEDADEARRKYAEIKGIDLSEVKDADVIERLYDNEVDYYWSDSDAPQFREFTLEVQGKEYTFTQTNSYGENEVYSHEAKDSTSLPSRWDDAEVGAAAMSLLRDKLGLDASESEATKWAGYTLDSQAKSDYQERLLINKSHKGDAFEYDVHWDEQNVAAFTRVTTQTVPLSYIQEEHPELAARLAAEGKKAAKVYFLEELQSDWAQQGRDKRDIFETRFYTPEMLSLSPENEANAAKRAKYTIETVKGAAVWDREALTYDVISPEGAVVSRLNASVGEAEETADARSNVNKWVINSTDGQVFSILKDSHATYEDAVRYIVKNKSYTLKVAELTQFELDAKQAELEAQVQEATTKAAILNRELGDIKDNEPAYEAKYAEIEKAREAEDKLRAELRNLPSGGVPVAPIVTNTDAWVSLALKDSLRAAAEGDFDLVSWTTGNQQTARWSGGLRQRVDRIGWEKTAEGVIHITAEKGRVIQGDTRYSENELTAAIGKTMAERIINDPNQTGEITGKDIVVADLGMTYFYGNAEGLNPEGKPAIVTKVANQLAKAMGAPTVRGLTMLPTRYTDDKFSSQPILEVTPQLKAMAMQGMPLFQKNLAYFDPEQMMIAMLKGANLSSMIHESGHFYLEALNKMSAHPNATQQMRDDFDKTMKWFGVPDRAAWDKMTLEQKRPYHEQWAQSNERWIMEGRAPTVEMQPIFARFRSWMLSVYKSLEQFLQQNPLAGRLDDEMRGVFARLIAAEDAIRETEAARAFVALTKPEGMPDDEYAKYIELGEEATQTAISEMGVRTLRDMKWLSNAKHKIIRQLQREAAAKRKVIREEVTKEVMQEPVNQARTFLTKGVVTSETGEEIQAAVGHKLDAASVREMYPATMLARPDLTKLRGMTGEGLAPDALAPMFGFRSGDSLVRELIEAEPAKDKIDGLTDQRMLERHGELIDAESVERAAEAAIHNEARARFLATGLNMLTKSKAPARDMANAAKEAAANVIARKKVRELRPKQYSAAETRANRKALELAPKSPAEAADAQRAALLNNRLAAAATEALEEVDSALRLATKFQSDGVRKNLDLEYLEQIDDLLKGFDFRKGQSLRAIDKRRSFADFIALQEERGFEPIVSADQMEVMSRKHYKDMTVEELRGLVEAVKHLDHLARLKKKLLTAKDEREFAERIAEAVSSIEANANRTVEERATPSDVAGRAAQLWRGFAAEHRKVASIVREMDGSKDGGVLWDLFIRPMNEAADNETEARAQAAEKMGEMFAAIKTKMGGIKGHLKVQRTVVPGTKLSMSYEERIMFALNWGNEGNRQRLLDGGLTGKRSLSEDEAQAVLATLDKQDMDFVQGVWDYLETFRPAVAEMERELTGKEPQWVEPSPVVTRFGTYRGGYFPAKYDAELSTRSESLEAAATLRMGMKGAFGNAGTRNGYTQKRAEQVVDRPILLSFNVISQHVSEVTHRVAWQRWVVDANRILRALDGTVRDSYGPEILREMKKLVEDAAAGDAPAANTVERVINHLRVGSTIVGMGWRITTAMLQPSGLAQSWVRVGGKWTALGVKQYLSNPMAAAESVESRSKLMRDRSRTMQREINEILNTVRVGDKLSNVQASYFWLIAKMQRTVDIPTWLGAYEKAVAQLELEKAADDKARAAIEEKAIAMADQAVLDAQSGGQLKDLARVQRGSPIYKLFTNFYSYFSATYNLNVESYRRTKFSDPAQFGAFVADMLILNTLPVLFSVALKEMLKGGCDNDDVACLLKQVGQEQTNYLFGQMILLREAGAAAGALTGDSFGYTGPAGLRFFSDLYKSGQQVGQGEADFAAWKAVTNTLAVPLHLPMGQVNATIDGIIAIENGDVEGVNVLSALIAGKPREEK